MLGWFFGPSGSLLELTSQFYTLFRVTNVPQELRLVRGETQLHKGNLTLSLLQNS